MTSDSLEDKEKAISSLNLAFENCTAALAFITNPESLLTEESPAANLDIVRKDYLSLLSLLHGSITKISLSLKPSSPTYRAAISPLLDTRNHISALVHCIRIFPKDQGATLVKEFLSVTRDVADSIKSLLKVFLDIEYQGSTDAGEAGDEYLVRTGAVHEVIERARGPGGLSGDNVSAVRRIWLRDCDSLADALAEVRDIYENAQSSSQSKDIDLMDDGWDELGIIFSMPMSPEERERCKKVQAIIHFTTCLHKRITKELPSIAYHTEVPPNEVNKLLDDLCQISSTLLSASDDLVSILYTQLQGNLTSSFSEVVAFQQIINQLRTMLSELFLNPNLNSLDSLDTLKDVRKWTVTCFEQIDKSITSLHDALSK